MNNELKTKSKTKKKRGWSATVREMKKYRAIYAMMLLGAACYIVFNYAPMYGIQIAFKDFYVTRGIWNSPWVGLKNFRELFATGNFWRVFSNTLYLSVLRLIFGFPAPIILALLLNELRSEKYKRVIQTSIYLPHFISWVVIAGIINVIFAMDGPINTILKSVGINEVNFLTSSKTFRSMVVGSDIWKEVGWGTIIYLAALTGISPDLYEAAYIDGANRWQQTIKITIPCILPTVSVLLILKVGGLTDGGFDQIFNMYNEAVYDVGDIIQTYNYRVGLGQGNYARSTALSIFLNVINCVLLLSTNFVSKKLSGSGLY